MNRKTVALAALLVLLAAGLRAAPHDRYLDVLIMKDGTSYRGVIVEQVPGETLRLETTGGTRMTFSWDEIDALEREKWPEGRLKIYYLDVVFLKSGIIFPGTIVEQVPGETLTLEAANGKEIVIRMDEIWKIVREKRLRGEEAPPEEERERMERFRIALDLQLTRGSGAEKPAAGSEGAGGLEEEIERLEEEMADLDREPEEAEDAERVALEEELARLREALDAARSARDQEAPAGGQSELQQTGEILQILIEELLEIAKGMWTDELVPGSQDYKQEISALQARLADGTRKLLEIAAAQPAAATAAGAAPAAAALKEELRELVPEVRSVARLRRQEDILATRTALVPILKRPDWNRPALRSTIGKMAASLPEADRREVYAQSRSRGAFKGFALNLLPSGLGSMVQGDWLGTALAWGIAGVGFGIWGLDAVGLYPAGATAMATGSIFVLCGYGFSLVRPIWYVGSQNSRKKALLGL
jgi:phage host-nuclease inhibitor protein Gam